MDKDIAPILVKCFNRFDADGMFDPEELDFPEFAEAASALTQLFNKRLEALGAEVIGEDDIFKNGQMPLSSHEYNNLIMTKGLNQLRATQRTKLKALLKEAQQ